MHTGENLYLRNLYEKAFAQKAGLKKHNRLNVEEKPSLRNVCDKVFIQNLMYSEQIYKSPH